MEEKDVNSSMTYEEVIAEAKRILLVLKNNAKYDDYNKDNERLNLVLDTGIEGLGKTKKYKSRLITAKILTRIINGLLREIAGDLKNLNYQYAAKELENLLSKFGYGLFEMPVGQVYDYNVDDFLSTITKVQRTKEEKSGSNTPLYILSSTFGCTRIHSDGTKRVIEKANVELGDSQPEFIVPRFVGVPEKI